LGEYPTTHNFFVHPFIDGHQYHLFLPGWFVPLLFLVEMFNTLMYNNSSASLKIDIAYFHTYFFAAVGCIYWSFSGMGSRLKFVLIRVIFSSFFFFLGFIHHRYLEKLLKGSTDGSYSFVIAIIVLSSLENVYQEKIGYFISWAEFSARSVWLPFVTDIVGIFITLFISKVLTKHLNQHTDIRYRIGQETYHIMSCHMLIFVLLNTALVHVIVDDVKTDAFTDIWFKFKPDMT
jgi:hypothetical protein